MSLSKLNAGASSIEDLNNLSKNLKIPISFIGSIYDFKPLKLNNKRGAILLLSPSKKIVNGHWVSIYKVSPTHYYYFDSYGVPPAQILVNSIGNKNLYYNSYQIQDLRSSHCGIYAIYYIYYMMKYKNPNEALTKLINHFHLYN